jgi:hypothetical protein
MFAPIVRVAEDRVKNNTYAWPRPGPGPAVAGPFNTTAPRMALKENSMSRFWKIAPLALLLLLVLPVDLNAAPCRKDGSNGGGRGMSEGCCGGCGGNSEDGQFSADHDTLHFLLSNRDGIRRTVTNTPDGVETVTESDDPDVVARIREHVAAMHRRLLDGDPIHMRDPLFAAIFERADEIHMEMGPTPNGIQVRETSSDPEVVALIQRHAEVISLFLENGHDEARRNHEIAGVTDDAAQPARHRQRDGSCCRDAAAEPGEDR